MVSYRDKICVNDEHPLAGQDIKYRAPDSRSRIPYRINYFYYWYEKGSITRRGLVLIVLPYVAKGASVT